ncbi:MAG TPA: hypothetical protein VGV37_19850 [Aliidongia sp.]|uniref:hypothetical protein n=1 Tax=Aliidongia sp. TaxID=1914230 RepID=UPI002DDCBBBE|nr:hypothetical protein [Aliidongia sp.]HEV2676790.1 hypothetical protein [Aliidongia sp.]
MHLSKLASLSLVGLFLAGPSFADSLVTAVLPASRSAVLGQGVTVFATVINSAGANLTGCSVASSQDDTSQTSIAYALTDPATNAVTSGLNPGFNLTNGASQTMVLTISGNSSEQAVQVRPVVQCSDGGTAVLSTSIDGLNTILFSASAQATPDVIALVAAPSGDGVLRIQGNGANAFAVAVSNVGAAGTITASVDTGDATLPITASICQTGTGGQCLGAAGSTASLSLAASATATFGVFVQANGQLPFAPANARIYVRFADAGQTVRGATSVAVTNGATLDATLPKGGIYEVEFPALSTSSTSTSQSLTQSAPVKRTAIRAKAMAKAAAAGNEAALLVAEDGEVQGFDSVGNIVSGTLATGSGLIQTGTIVYQAIGTTDASSEAWAGAIGQRSWLSAELVNHATPVGRFGPVSFSVSGTYDAPDYERTSSLALVSGAWKLRDGDGTLVGSATFKTNGTYSGSLEGCSFSGSVSLIDTRYSLYHLVLNQASCPAGGLIAQSFAGLAVLGDDQATDDSLIFIGNDATRGGATFMPFSRN